MKDVFILIWYAIRDNWKRILLNSFLYFFGFISIVCTAYCYGLVLGLYPVGGKGYAAVCMMFITAGTAAMIKLLTQLVEHRDK